MLADNWSVSVFPLFALTGGRIIPQANASVVRWAHYITYLSIYPYLNTILSIFTELPKPRLRCQLMGCTLRLSNRKKSVIFSGMYIVSRETSLELEPEASRHGPGVFQSVQTRFPLDAIWDPWTKIEIYCENQKEICIPIGRFSNSWAYCRVARNYYPKKEDNLTVGHRDFISSKPDQKWT